MSFEQSWRCMAYGTGWSWLHLAAPLLMPISQLYAWGGRLRRHLYQSGAAKAAALDVPVISVGNLTVGGSGKTPLCIYLAEHLQTMGFHPAILLRGYRRKSREELAAARDTFSAERICVIGDEAALIVHRSTVPVGIGKERTSVAQRIQEARAVDLILLDDGFQHLRLSRNLDILLCDHKNPLGNGWTLPYGPLREPVSALRRASAVVWNGGDSSASIVDNRSLPQFCGALQWQAVVPFAAWRQRDRRSAWTVDSLLNLEAGLLSGIGAPERLQKQAEAYGVKVRRHWVFADHHWFSVEEIKKAMDEFLDIPILLTEKDAIRVWPLAESLGETQARLYVIQARWQMRDEPAFLHWLKSALPLGCRRG